MSQYTLKGARPPAPSGSISYTPVVAAGFAVSTARQLIASAHLPAVHRPEAQSPFAPQAVPKVQLGAQAGAAHFPFVHAPEPQSVLAPHTCPSEQAGAHAGAAHLPLVQTAEAQSAAT